jgi:dGTPase
MALAPYAFDVATSRGRRYPESRHPYRNDFARDRDRVVHSRAFRRLEAKTQVFTTRYSDHFRNRLTHTLEVAQIARTVAGALDLNSDLAEALALVHDIGHPPFGHAGERKLDELMRPYGEGFDHNLQALRIVEQFEQRYLDFPGLNLTFEVREGIVKHSRDYDVREWPSLAEYVLDQRPPIEAQLIDFVDEIAYNSADLDDGYEAKLIDGEMIRREVPLFDWFYEEVERTHPQGIEKLKFNEAAKRVLDHLATDLIENTKRVLAVSAIESVQDVRRSPKRLAGFSTGVAGENASLKRFLLAHLYSHPAIVVDRERSVEALGELFHLYMANPEALPKAYAVLAQAGSRHRVVCDYIAGMTDHYLLRQHADLLRTSRAPSAK